MTDKLRKILDNMHKYNMEHLANINFGLSEDVVYEALVVAPSYAPHKVIRDESYKITEMGSQSYCTGYEVVKDELRIVDILSKKHLYFAPILLLWNIPIWRR